jgi:cysteinyl-tRNA synthetase
MSIKIYNTLTRQKEELKPITEGVIKIYNCGPTVYDFFHIGNARNFIVFDCFRRYLEYKGFKVTFVQNITDVDDKIINKANKEGKSWKEIAEQYTEEYFKDADALGVKRADVHPKATEHIKEMIEIIEKLIQKELAYEVSGDVFYDVSRLKAYQLSHQNIEELSAGARIDINEKKKNPMDFALWKKSKEGEPCWDSPWGPGRPGWHIECSAMSMKYLSENFDIHGGGIDLVFPHHENEIAQSNGATGHRVVNCWMHNGHLNIEGEKMSKSLGNFLLIRDILKKYTPQAIRVFLLSAHYRSPLDYTQKNMDNAKEAYSEIYNTYFRLISILGTVPDLPAESSRIGTVPNIDIANLVKTQKEKFIVSLDDDFNTAQALGNLFELINGVKQVISKKDFSCNKQMLKELRIAKDTILSLTSLFGIEPKSDNLTEDEVKLIKERDEARRNKDWTKSDNIRNLLKEKGIILEDITSGTIAIKKPQ